VSSTDSTSLDQDDASNPDQDGFDAARVLRVAMIVAALVSGFAAAHGLLMTIQHAAAEIPAGTITRVEPGRGGYRITLDDGGGKIAHFPSDILETTGRSIQLKPGMPVEKRIGSLTYSIAGESRGGLLWAMRQWLLPARVTLPLAVYFIVSWLLVFRASEHRRRVAVEALVVPLVRWIVIALTMLIGMALLMGCVIIFGRLLFRMAG
jgi:hypothetical protein